VARRVQCGIVDLTYCRQDAIAPGTWGPIFEKSYDEFTIVKSS